jgi:two-component system cell cycle sensor histidine kinase/response regulator CckA
VLVRNVLTRLGYRVLEATTGVTALDVWKEHQQDIRLLLTDLVMPDGMTGKALAEQLVAQNAKLKVIYTSGYSREIAGKDFPLQDGVNFLSKPFQAAKLAQTVRANLDAL